jgi:hypothetical protein
VCLSQQPIYASVASVQVIISVCLLVVSRLEVVLFYFSVGCQTPKNVCSAIVSRVEPGTPFLEFRIEKNILLLVSAFFVSNCSLGHPG